MKKARYVVAKVKNPAFAKNEIFLATESLQSPRFKALRQRYKLDKVVRGQKNEMKRILLLRHWLKQHIAINNENPTRTSGDAFGILDAALKGGEFHCAHFSLVQNAVMNAFGYVTRCLGAGWGQRREGYYPTVHHGVNEVWSNQYCKWFLSDAKYDVQFEKNGIPLSALEIRNELIKNRTANVKRVIGPNRKIFKGPQTELSARIYNWVSWSIQGDPHSSWPLSRSSALVVYDDPHYRAHTWYRRGRKGIAKHWAYDAGFFIPIRHREWIEWTPNVLEVTTRIRGDTAHARIVSSTPNFKEYQVKEAGRPWRRCRDILALKLTRKRHEWRLRSMNSAGVAGPENRLVIKRKGC